MNSLCQTLMNPISEILKLFKEGKISQQWEMFVLGNTELPRRAQTLDDNAVKDMIDKTRRMQYFMRRSKQVFTVR